MKTLPQIMCEAIRDRLVDLEECAANGDTVAGVLVKDFREALTYWEAKC